MFTALSMVLRLFTRTYCALRPLIKAAAPMVLIRFESRVRAYISSRSYFAVPDSFIDETPATPPPLKSVLPWHFFELELSSAPSARCHHTAVWTGSEAIIWGGTTSHARLYTPNLRSGGRFDPKSNTWHPVTTDNSPSKRNDHRAVWARDRMVVFGGTEAKAADTKDTATTWTCTNPNALHFYNPATDTWSEISTKSAPPGRRAHCMAFTGTEIIVWGGMIVSNAPHEHQRSPSYSTKETNSGGIFNLDTMTWRPMPGKAAPSPRSFASSVWTGKDFIVWGGLTGQLSSRKGTWDGAAFNPLTNTWRPLPPPPISQLAFHQAVWTGKEMIIWGGVSAHSLTTSAAGAAYNPEANAWRPLAPSGLTQRFYHAMVWTGEELVVWGGSVPAATSAIKLLSDGARYYPDTDRWIAIKDDAPTTPRHGHTPVCMDSGVLFFGGMMGDDQPISSTLILTFKEVKIHQEKAVTAGRRVATVGFGNYANMSNSEALRIRDAELKTALISKEESLKYLNSYLFGIRAYATLPLAKQHEIGLIGARLHSLGEEVLRRAGLPEEFWHLNILEPSNLDAISTFLSGELARSLNKTFAVR